MTPGDATLRRLFAIHRIYGAFAEERSEAEHEEERKRNRRRSGRVIERSVRPIVAALNAVPGIETTNSCGGHQRPYAWQMPAGTFFVELDVARTRAGWAALEIVADATFKAAPTASLTAWAHLDDDNDHSLSFRLAGTTADALAIVQLLKASKVARK